VALVRQVVLCEERKRKRDRAERGEINSILARFSFFFQSVHFSFKSEGS
jgi:hypothetical protein